MSVPLAPLPSLERVEGSARRRRVPSDQEVEQQLEELIQEPDRDLTDTHISLVGTHTSKLIEDNFEREIFGESSGELLIADISPPKLVSEEPDLVSNKENVAVSSRKQFDFTPATSVDGVSVARAE